MSKKGKTVSVALLAVLIGALTLNAQVRGGSITRVYDNFNSKWIDPTKWEIHPNCWSGPPLECVREIQSGQLRLLVRTIGATNSDSGGQDSQSFLAFANPNSIRSITTTVTVRAANGGTCSTNSYVGTAKAGVGGRFFNTGTGNVADDVNGVLVLSSYASLGPNTLDVGGWIGNGNGVNIWTHMGNYSIGTRLIVTIAWDQPNHQFVFAARPDGGATNQVSVPYNLPDTQPPAGPWKILSVDGGPPNCTSSQAFSNVEALFDNVIVK